jgi:uncharacterized protein Veg
MSQIDEQLTASVDPKKFGTCLMTKSDGRKRQRQRAVLLLSVYPL